MTIIESSPHNFALYHFILKIKNYKIKFYKRYSEFRKLARDDSYLEPIKQGKWWYLGGSTSEYLKDR